MKKVIVRILIFLLVLLLLAWLLYPTVADQIARKGHLEEAEAYLKVVHGKSSEEIARMLEDADAFNQELGEIQPGDVFSAATERSSTKYRNLLDFRNGMIGQLEIPSIQVSLPILHISAEVRPDKALVHLEGSSLPGTGGGTHVVLAGPRKQRAPGILGDLALTGDRMLEDLDRLTPGNEMMILLGNRTLLYEVTGVQTLSPQGLREWTAERNEGEDRLTLITERDGRRLLVEAVRIPVRDAVEKLQAEDSAVIPADWITILVLGIPLMLLGVLVMIIVERFKKRSYRLPTEIKAKAIEKEQEPEKEQKAGTETKPEPEKKTEPETKSETETTTESEMKQETETEKEKAEENSDEQPEEKTEK